MRTIPIPSRNAVGASGPAEVQRQALTSNVRMDGRAMGAVGAALVQAGQTVQGGAELLGRFALEKQDAINKGILANEETIRMETAAKIQGFAAANLGDPDSWAKMSNETWKGYEEGRAARAKAGSWGPDVIARDTLQTKLYRADFRIKFTAEQDRALVLQSNARLESNAETKLRAGDYEGFKASMNEMNLFPDVKARRIRQGLEEGLYKVANNQLDALRDLPPAKSVESIKVFIGALKEKNKDGSYVNFEEKEGGMGLGGRANLESIANSRIREAEAAQARTGRSIVSRAKLGQPLEAMVSQAVQSGEMSMEIASAFLPDMRLGEQLFQTRQEAKAAAKAKAEDVEAKRLEAEADAQTTRQMNAEERLRSNLGETVSLRDIEKAEAIGLARPKDTAGITRESADRLRSELKAKVAGEAIGAPGFTGIESKLNGKMGSYLLFGDSAQDAPDEQVRLVKQIADAKLSKESRLKLMEKFFEVRAYDLKDNELTERIGDRDISPEEADGRAALLSYFKKQTALAPSPESVGELYFRQSAAIETWFQRNPNATPELRKKTMEQFKSAFSREIDDLAGIQALKDLY